MSTWRRLHLNETVKAMATPDRTRFFVSVREPAGETRHPLECYRSTLSSAQETADGIMQTYYPHDCDEQTCGARHQLGD
jgi:hypothetical protein